MVFILSVAQGDIRERVSAEYQLKAAFLLKFLNFIHPFDDEEHLSLCLIGPNPFGETLERLASLNAVPGKTVEIRELSTYREDIPCQFLYIARSEEPRLSSLIKALGTAQVVTVSDIEGFVEQGGIIELSVEGRSVKFIINSDEALKRGIQVSSQLLALAKTVIHHNGG